MIGRRRTRLPAAPDVADLRRLAAGRTDARVLRSTYASHPSLSPDAVDDAIALGISDREAFALARRAGSYVRMLGGVSMDTVRRTADLATAVRSAASVADAKGPLVELREILRRLDAGERL